MIQKIGKYRILERIGRGGMGTVFKAHDPVLDRLVAIKVISGEGEITDELKTRFYREAQACARLNHPNIVVVHDLGEDAGRLYIVMEFLDGDELKALIQQRRSLSLEEKLGLMVQVCEGLSYAHQNGVIHRDIKPGNIFVLRNGQVKILDFGIARIATTDSGLTRTGLIMGTLRYMSPEQARGKVDHRSDMFSAGTVFYELLCYRAAFDSEDPMETLERLRSEDPPPLTEIDPSIPTELAAIIERALRKDPGQRFPDMAQMKVKLEQVRRRFTDELERLQAHVRAQLDQARELQTRLSACLCQPPEDETVPVVDERVRLSDLQALDRQLAGQIERLREAVERAESIQPAVARGVELLERGDFAAAIAQFEPVLRDMPEHGQARQAIEQARTRQAEVARLLEDARAAHQQRAYPRAIELLDGLAAISPVAAGGPAAAELRRAAETAGREQEAAQRAREAMQAARAAAEEVDAARHAAVIWTEADAKSIEGDLALGQHAYRAAETRFQEAVAAYERATTATRQAVEAMRASRARAEEAAQQAGQARQLATEANAGTFAAPKWSTAQAKEASAQGAFVREDYTTAQALLGDARRLYEEAARDARVAAEAEAQRHAAQGEADRLRQAVVAARRAAEEAGARQLAAEAFAKAETTEQAANDAVSRQAFADALGRLRKAETAYQEAGRQAAQALGAARARAEAAAREASQAKQAANGQNPAKYAASKWAAAQAREAAGQSALNRSDFGAAQTGLVEARRLFEEAGREARAASEAEAQRKAAETEAARLRQVAGAARRAAEEAGAAQAAAPQLQEGQAAEQAAEAAFSRQAFADAQSRFRAAEQAYVQAGRQATAQQALAAALADAQRLIGEGRPDRAQEALARVRQLAPGHPELGRLEAQAQRAAEARKIREQVRVLIDNARRLQARREYSRALELAEQAVRLAPDEARAVRLRDEIEEAARQGAAAGPAPQAEAEPADAAEPEAEAERAPRVPSLPGALRRFGRAHLAVGAGVMLAVLIGVGYAMWPTVKPPPPPPPPPDIVRPITPPATPQAKAEELRKAMRDAREDARKVEAERLAPKLWTAAADKDREAEAALGKQDFAGAQTGYTDAQQTYQRAAEEARKQIRLITAQADLRPLQEQAAQARRRAELVDASRLAASLWAKATGVEKSADDAIKQQEFDRAQALLRDAEQAYKAAEGEANKQNAAISDARRQEIEAQQRALKAAEQVAAGAAKARRDAEQADASRFASKNFVAALDKEKEGQLALGRKDYGAAESRFREAQQEYERAKQAAETQKKEEAIVAERQRGAEQARDRMAQARGQAEQVDAKRWAAKLWQDGTGKESDGQAALSRKEYPTAQQRFRDAQQEYERARQEAVRAAEAERQRLAKLQAEEAERQRLAKLQAEEAERQRLAKLQADEAERQRLAKQRADEAERQRLAKLQADEAAKQAVLRQEMERIRGTVSSGRDQAVKSEAEKLAKDLFDAARTRESQADGLATRQALAEATAAYQDAARRYGDAFRRAQTLRQERAEADQARIRMQAEKQKARAEASEFKAAVAEEQQGDTTYQRLAFKEASGHYGAAQGLFAKATRPVDPGPPPIDPKTEVLAALNVYKRAIEAKDIGLYQQVYPGVTSDSLRKVRLSFDQMKSQTVDFRDVSVEVSGDEAQARGRRFDVFVPKDGREIRNESAFLIRLKRTANRWVIQAMN